MPRERLARVTYAPSLDQLSYTDADGKRRAIAEEQNGEHAQIFESIQHHLGGSLEDEEADTWSAIKGPLTLLGFVVLIGGIVIAASLGADPDAEITGRRRGMKQLMNWLGYTVGTPILSVIVGLLVLASLAFVIHRVVKRPQRQALVF